MNIAIIPARGGSKRIPRKNIRHFSGRPMIAWPIATALASGLFTRVIVSTEDPEIAAVATASGAEVPTLRPAGLADDHATVVDVMRHSVSDLMQEHSDLEAICCIYATAPMLKRENLVAGLRLFQEGEWNYVFSATEFGSSVHRGFVVGFTGLEMLFPNHSLARTQDLPRVFHDAAQFYWGRPSAWMQRLPVFGEGSTIIELPRWQTQDIDTEEDWRFAEFLHERSLRVIDGEGD